MGIITVRRFLNTHPVSLALLGLSAVALLAALFLFLRSNNPAYSKTAAMVGMGLAMFAWVAHKLTQVNK